MEQISVNRRLGDYVFSAISKESLDKKTPKVLLNILERVYTRDNNRSLYIVSGRVSAGNKKLPVGKQEFPLYLLQSSKIEEHRNLSTLFELSKDRETRDDQIYDVQEVCKSFIKKTGVSDITVEFGRKVLINFYQFTIYKPHLDHLFNDELRNCYAEGIVKSERKPDYDPVTSV